MNTKIPHCAHFASIFVCSIPFNFGELNKIILDALAEHENMKKACNDVLKIVFVDHCRVEFRKTSDIKKENIGLCGVVCKEFY